MNVKTAKKPESRIDTNYLSKFKMSTFGNDNLYPQTIASIAASIRYSNAMLESICEIH